MDTIPKVNNSFFINPHLSPKSDFVNIIAHVRSRAEGI